VRRWRRWVQTFFAGLAAFFAGDFLVGFIGQTYRPGKEIGAAIGFAAITFFFGEREGKANQGTQETAPDATVHLHATGALSGTGTLAGTASVVVPAEVTATAHDARVVVTEGGWTFFNAATDGGVRLSINRPNGERGRISSCIVEKDGRKWMFRTGSFPFTNLGKDLPDCSVDFPAQFPRKRKDPQLTPGWYSFRWVVAYGAFLIEEPTYRTVVRGSFEYGGGSE
jgi:hypothetical protein